jgi:hypothetical protein
MVRRRRNLAIKRHCGHYGGHGYERSNRPVFDRRLPRPPSYPPINFTRRKLKGAKEANCAEAQQLYASVVQGSE